MAQDDKKQPVDDIVDRWKENPIQEESDRVFNHIPAEQPEGRTPNDQDDEKQSFWDKRAKAAENKLDQQYADREDQRKAELDELNAAQNRFNYRKEGDQQPTNPRRRFSQLLNKKNGIRGGIAGGGIGIALALFSFLTPFKIPGIMQMVADNTGQRLEQITTHRAKVIIARYIYSQAGIPGDPVVTGKGPVSSLIATLRANNFEKKLDLKGLHIVKDESGGVRLQVGKGLNVTNKEWSDLVDPETGKNVFKNPEAILKALDSNQLTSKMIDNLVKEEIPSWRWMKRAKFAKWLKLRYNISRYGLAKSEETDPDKKKQEMQETRVKEANARSTENAIDALNCMDSGPKCPVPDAENGENTRLANSDATESALRDTLNQAGDDVAKQAGEEAAKGVTETATKLSARVAKMAIPVVDIIDLVATINHFAMSAMDAADNDLIVQLPAQMRSTAYAQIYADWAGYGAQQQAGELDNDFANVLATQMDGIEQSQAFACLNSTSGTGAILASLTSTAYAAEAPCTAGVPPKERIDENNPSAIKKALDKQKEVLGFNAPAVLKYTPSNILLEAWYQASNAITDKLADVILGQYKIEYAILDSITSAITGIDVKSEREQWLSDVTTKMMSSMLSILGLTIDPMDSGADLGNDIIGGGLVSYDTYCEAIGCRTLTTAQAKTQDTSIAAERAQDIANKGWFYAMFSPDTTSSITTQLAIALPSGLGVQNFNASTGVSQLASLVSNVPDRLVGSLLGGKANAASPTNVADLYGKTLHGGTPEDIAQPLAPEAISGDECQKVSKGDYDNCTIDKTVASAMQCGVDDKMRAGPDCSFANGTAGGGTRVMTYNILGGEHTNDGGVSVSTRLDNVVTTIAAKQPSIIGFQEVNTQEQRKGLADKLGDTYDYYPEGLGDGEAGRPIYWNRQEFTLVDHGVYDYDRYDNPHTKFPWVKLQSKSSGGGMIYVFNTHTASGDKNGEKTNSGASPPVQRRDEANSLVKTAQSVVKDNTPVILTGDFNSTCNNATGYDEPMSTNDLPCHIFEKSTPTFTDAEVNATANGKPVANAEYNTSHDSVGQQAKNNDGQGRHIDHVFFTAGVSATSWENVIDSPNTPTKQASDHSPVIVSLAIPGILDSTDDPATTGSAVVGDDYRKGCATVGPNCSGQCVSFVEFRLRKFIRPDFFVPGNGQDIAPNLGKMGYTVNHTPAVNSVVSWPAGGVPGGHANSTYGHTAMVSGVNADKSIVVEEYNYTHSLGYDKRTIPASVANKLTYAHTEKDFKN